ncbi:MAG: putative peptide transporter, peptide-binding protein [Herminiimonas sp.]|nr:putative peptide transporter, peptide-binding protein [Herminiimonas sp.]
MIYDTLFGINASGKVRPQMVDRYSASPDGKTWTFTLRRKLAFHDGEPVTSADVVASLRRWGQRDALGQKMFAALALIETTDSETVRMSFKEPFGMVLEALSKPASSPPFIMPKRVAETPADKQIEDTTGSGPYIFKKDDPAVQLRLRQGVLCFRGLFDFPSSRVSKPTARSSARLADAILAGLPPTAGQSKGLPQRPPPHWTEAAALRRRPQ